MDVTALPYGINTPAGFLTCYLVMLPICFKYSPAFGNTITPAEYADKAFKAAATANFIGGIFEVCGIFLGNFLRHNMPRVDLSVHAQGLPRQRRPVPCPRAMRLRARPSSTTRRRRANTTRPRPAIRRG